jgi:excisionase family DNA binding protein
MPANYLTTRKAALLLGISVRTAQLWVESGRLVGWKTDGGHRRISRASVLLASQGLAAQAVVADAPYSMPVLIVEDDATLIRLYKAQLASWPFGVTIYTAPNGYEALVLAGEMKPRLLICDLRLPGVNGFQIVRAVCEMRRFDNMGIVVVSGLPEPEIRAHGGVPARVDIMGKPIDFARLKTIVEKYWTLGARGAETPAP